MSEDSPMQTVIWLIVSVELSYILLPFSACKVPVVSTRVRTILVLGYWVLGNVHRYWYWGIFFVVLTPNTILMPVNDYLVTLLTCTLTDAIVCLDTMLICCCLLNTIIVIIMGFLWSLLCCTLVSVLVLLEANIIGYWILGAFLGIVLTLMSTDMLRHLTNCLYHHHYRRRHYFTDASVCVVAAGQKKERCNQKPAECRQRQEANCQHANINKRNQNSAIAVASAVAVVTVC